MNGTDASQNWLNLYFFYYYVVVYLLFYVIIVFLYISGFQVISVELNFL